MLICFDIGGSHIKAAAFEAMADEPIVIRRPTPLQDLSLFRKTILDLVKELGPDPRAISISQTGIVDPDTGILRCANIPSVDGIALADILNRDLGLPVTIANDADCFALAESLLGAGRGHANVFAIILGSGVGGTMVLDGRIVRGAGGFAGEWGHGPILRPVLAPNGRPIPLVSCGCGQIGCINTVGGARGLEYLASAITGDAIGSTEIVAEWEAGNPAISTVIEAYLDLVAPALAMAVNITGASIIPAGGGLANSARLMAALDQAVRARILRKTDAPLIVPGQLTVEPGLKGAAILAFQALDHV